MKQCKNCQWNGQLMICDIWKAEQKGVCDYYKLDRYQAFVIACNDLGRAFAKVFYLQQITEWLNNKLKKIRR